jgi:lysophospholipase L1-like esterase
MFRRLKAIPKCLLYIVSCLFLIEILLRVGLALIIEPRLFFWGTIFAPRYSEHSVHRHDNVQISYSKYIPNQEKTDTDEFGETFRVKINRQGFRGEDFTAAKDENTIRIVTLGASSTFGFHVRGEHAYPAVMQDLLNSSDSPKKFEVYNLGIPHLRSTGIHALFLAEALPLKPDVVTFYEGINDAALMLATPAMIKFQEYSAQLLLVWIINEIAAPLQEFDQTEYKLQLAKKPASFVKNVDAIYQECKKRKILFITASQQAQSLLIEPEQMKGLTYAEEQARVREKLAHEPVNAHELWFMIHNEIMKALRQWALSEQVPFVDIINSLDPHRDTLLSWVHLNIEGNQLVAEAFAEKIRELILEQNSSNQLLHSNKKGQTTEAVSFEKNGSH